MPPDSPLNNPKFLAAVFAPDSVKDHNNTQAIDVGNNTLIAARVTDYKAPTVPAFDTVKDAVRTKVIAEDGCGDGEEGRRGEARRICRSRNRRRGFTSAVTVSRNDAQGLPPAALSAIFKADASKLPAYVGVDLGEDGYAIYRVNGIEKATPVAADRLAGAQQQVAQVYAQAEMEAYLDSLKARSKVKLSTRRRRADRRNELSNIDASQKKPRCPKDSGAFVWRCPDSSSRRVAERCPNGAHRQA